MGDNDYEAGLRDGKIEALEAMQNAQNDRLDHHDGRLHLQERITYGILGAIFFMQFFPAIQGWLMP